MSAARNKTLKTAGCAVLAVLKVAVDSIFFINEVTLIAEESP